MRYISYRERNVSTWRASPIRSLPRWYYFKYCAWRVVLSETRERWPLFSPRGQANEFFRGETRGKATTRHRRSLRGLYSLYCFSITIPYHRYYVRRLVLPFQRGREEQPCNFHEWELIRKLNLVLRFWTCSGRYIRWKKCNVGEIETKFWTSNRQHFYLLAFKNCTKSRQIPFNNED